MSVFGADMNQVAASSGSEPSDTLISQLNHRNIGDEYVGYELGRRSVCVPAWSCQEGVDVEGCTPRTVTASLIEKAGLVVGFGCDLSPIDTPESLKQWHDLPAVSDGYGTAREAILERLEVLLDELAPGSHVE